ncbi:metallophosphoesterase [Ilyomonas limi]|nr:metallophosphoesterase [Ilyomonas limi]
MERQYKQSKMVNWYQPRMLLSIGLKAVISGTFGNYADRRELEAALDNNLDNEKEWEQLETEYGKNEEIWIDVINDTGDGFNSTFAVAKTVAQKTLTFSYTNEEGNLQSVTTQRGKILIFGGDEVYPFPTLEEYTNRFKIPFASACDDVAELTKENDRPHLYAIPGNHDWYDGLGNFIKLFCQQRWIGIWSTKQHRSYFALPLPCNYWIWATDIQLNSDIDKPQLNYFEAIAKTEMKDNDRIILITAEPAWVYKQIHKEDRSYDKLKFFVDNYIHNKNGCTGRTFKLAATLTGDLHQYARFCNKEKPQGHQYFTAGGGGAFLHLTHNLPSCLKSIREGDDAANDIYQQKVFPEKKDSHRLLLGNLLFPFKNVTFTFLLFCIYLFIFWIVQDHYPGAFINAMKYHYPFVHFVFTVLSHPFLCILTLGLSAGFYAFSDTNVTSKAAPVAGFIHAVAQAVVLLLTLYYNSSLWYVLNAENYSLVAKIVTALFASFVGSIIAAFVMGVYLYVSNLLFNMHINEASSSLASPDYKNFLRLHVHKDGVTVYPVGIKKVPRKWQQHYNKDKDTYSFTGAVVESALIEEPIHILNNQL